MSVIRVIAGTYRSRILQEVESENTRVTKDRVKEQMFNSIGPLYGEIKVLDLFAGSGSLGIEAISRGALYCTFVDNLTEAINVITNNILSLKIQDKSEIVLNDYLTFLETTDQTFDLILLDPPYKLAVIDEIIDILGRRKMLNIDGSIVCLYSKNISIKDNNNGIIEYKKKISGITKVSFMKWSD